MHKLKKAAVAAVAGASLLVGGLGSLAFWQDPEESPGGTITSGSLDLVPTDCEAWEVDGVVRDLATFRIVPGDVLTRSCDFTVDLVGDNLETALAFDAPDLTQSTLADELTFGAQYAVNPPATDPVFEPLPAGDATLTDDLADGDEIEVQYRVELPFDGNETVPGVDNDSNSGEEFNPGPELTAVLTDLTVTLRQV